MGGSRPPQCEGKHRQGKTVDGLNTRFAVRGDRQLQHAVCRTVIAIAADLSNVPTATDSSAGKECYGLGGCSSHPTHPAGTLGALPALQPDNAHTHRHHRLYSSRHCAGCIIRQEGRGDRQLHTTPVQLLCSVHVCPPAAPARTHSSSSRPSGFHTMPTHLRPAGHQAELPQRWQVYSQCQPSKTHQAHVCMCKREKHYTHQSTTHARQNKGHIPHPHYKGAPMHRINMTEAPPLPHTSRDTASTEESHRDTDTAASPSSLQVSAACNPTTCRAISNIMGRRITHSARPTDLSP